MQINQLINQASVRQYLAHLKAQGVPPATIERKLASIRRFSAWARPSGRVPEVIKVQPSTPGWNPKTPRGALSNLYSAYANSRLSSYLHLAILVLFSAALAVFGYNQIFKEAQIGQAYPQAPNPQSPNRYLSFQARLTDSSDNPITTPTDFRFIIYNDVTASGSAKLWEEQRYIDPDQDGIFSVTLGTETAIASTVFTENIDLWLGVTVETDAEATPRQRIATVGYALNAETLQGFPPSASASADQIPVITQEGDLVLAAASPMVYSSSGTFAIKGQALSVVTDTGTNGNIAIAPDGTGQVNLTGNTTTTNFFNVSNAQLTSGSLITGTVANDNTGFKLIDLLAGSSPASKFSVADTGNVTLAGDLAITGGNITTAVTADSTLTVTGTLTANALFDANGIVTLGDGGDTITLNGSSLTLTGFNTCTALETDGSGVLACGSDGGGGGGGTWQENTGAISPINNTWDVLIGGTATASAKFAFINVNSGTPTASVSAGTAGAAYLTATGTLATTAMQTLTLGDASTGNLNFYSASNKLTSAGNLTLAGDLTITGNDLFMATNTANYFLMADGTNYNPVTPAAAVTGLGLDAGGAGDIWVEKAGDTMTGALINTLATGNSLVWDTNTLVVDATNDRVGIGNATPIGKLDVSGAVTGKALAIFNETGDQDILTASASGTTVFRLDRSGYAYYQRYADLANSAYYLDPAATGVNLAIAAGSITSGVADSSTAVGFTLNTTNALSTQGAKLLSVLSNSTEKMYLDKDGNLYVSGTIVSGNGTSMLLTNKSGGIVASKAIVVLDTSNNTSFTTTTTPYSKAGFGVVVGVGLGVANDANGDGVCDSNDICMVAFGGSVNVTVKNATTAVKGDYLFTSDTAGSAVASAKQYDGLVGIVNDTANSASGYLKMIFKVQPQVTAAAAIDKTTKHNEYWLYADQYQAVGEGSNTDTNLLQRGIAFDTFTDTTKTDSANTTASLDTNTQRTGLIGGQTLATSTTDNAGNTYLGSNTVNDQYYYDRTKDSSPQVQVELGIDPNWYNGVTLSVATTSASFSQNSTITKPNPNLSTTYNGSLIKVTGTDTTPRTIYITIKSPTTFDWTDYNGQAATGVTMTPGTAQALGTTGVSATFTNARYNTGDVFKIASWFVEPSGSTRGGTAKFPERSNVVGSGTGSGSWIDIIDADTQKLWMRFQTGGTTVSWSNGYLIGGNGAGNVAIISSVSALNGNIYFSKGTNDVWAGLGTINFNTDRGNIRNSSTTYGGFFKGNVAQRNTDLGFNASNAFSIVSSLSNDVSAAVIPNQPTQTTTVSGWGYITISTASNGNETVNLPYKFNNNPTINISGAGRTTTQPTTVASCGNNQGDTWTARNTTTTNFLAQFYERNDTTDTGYVCYTWTATGQVSPRTYVAVATGTTGAAGGLSIINETDQSVVHGTRANASNFDVSFAKGDLYYAYYDTASTCYYLGVKRGIATTSTGDHYTWADAFYDRSDTAVGAPTALRSGPKIMGTCGVAINSLSVTPETSTVDGKSNTIYVGTAAGLTVIQEKTSGGNTGDDGDQANGSVKYYTKDYVSEEMVGDIRGMWPLSANGAISMSDASIKADTLTNNGTATAVTGVRGAAASFNGSTQYLSCTDAACGGTSKTDIGTGNWSVGAWFKTSSSSDQAIITKGTGSDYSYALETNHGGAGKVDFTLHTAAGANYISATSNTTITDGQWHFAVGTWTASGTTISIYVDGRLETTSTTTSGSLDTDSAGPFQIGNWNGLSRYFTGTIDEPFVTSTALSPSTIKHMYEVGYRALQSHGTGLGGGAADTNQQLGMISTGTNTVGVAQPDWNNQYMYVGTNSTTLGALSKIQLNSDTNIKTYNSSANVPAGGALLVDEDVTSLAVGYNLVSAGSAASGVKTMGVDNNATATSGNFIGKTITTAESFNQAYLWAQYVLDASDASNTIQVWASNDGGSNYYQCNLTNTDSSRSPSEYEYFCQFNTAGSSLKTKFVMARGSTKTNTYVSKYGISWIDSNAIAGSAAGSGLYTTSGTSVANGSYIDVAHNQNSNDLISNGWQYNTATSKWEQIDVSGNEQATSSAQVNYNTEANYTQENMAYAVTLTPSATTGDITLTLGSGTWNSDARIKAGTRVVGNGGIATITGTPAAQTTIAATVTTAFTNTNAIASGSWYLYGTTFDGSVAKINTGTVTQSATGGTITTSGGNTIHTFTSGGTFTPPSSANVTYLVVAGGGGGGRGFAGGGGAGGLKTASGFAVTAQAYTITVGGGGAGSTADASKGVNGSNSVFSTVTATGGGGGGSMSNDVGANGGSGGGGSAAGAGGTGNSGEGYAGGGAVSSTQGGSGGGGAGAVGSNNYPDNNGGNGGVGVASSISGSSVYYAGGGGGGSNGGTAGTGGNGGGGNGTNSNTTAANGTANSGGGGGGGGRTPGVSNGNGGAGGSGIVIISYPTGTFTAQSTPTSQNYSVVTNTDQLATASWDHVDSVAVTETLNSQTINYSVSFDGRTTFYIYDSTASNNGWRPIARNNSGTWQYNSNTTAGVSNVTWTSATYNSQNGAISQAAGVTQNQMTGTQLAAVTAVQWREINGFKPTTNTLDFAAALKTTSASQIPQVDQIKVNYTQAGYKIVQTDANTARLYNYSGAAQNLRLDVITGGLGRNAGTVSLAPAAADVDSQASTNSIWINKTGSGGNLLKLQQSGTDVLNLSSTALTLTGNFLPGTDNTYSLGATSSARFKDLYLGPASLHIQSKSTDAGYPALGLDYALGINTAGSLVTSLNGTSNALMAITQGGNVGIGTTGPTNILSLGNTAAQKFWIENTAAGTVGRALTVAAGGTVAGSTDITGGNLILQSGLGTGTGASTISFQTGTTLGTGTTLQTMSTKMTILGSGNVGIGTTGPASLLHIQAASGAGVAAGLTIKVPTGSGGSESGDPSIYFSTGTGGTEDWAIGTDNSDSDKFKISNSPTLGTTDYLTIDGTNGNVGIGTTAPRGKFDVNGTFLMAGGNQMQITNSSGSTGLQLIGGDGSENTIGTMGVNEDLVLRTNSSARMRIASTGYVTFYNGHGDLAENYLASGKVLRGSLVSIDTTKNKTVLPANLSHQSIIGVVSTAPGAVMDEDGGFMIGSDTKLQYENEKAPIALQGTAPTLVTSQNGIIEVGDAVGISNISGFGAKMITAGQVVGKALQKLETNSCTNASSVASINWPDDDGKNTLKPCFRLPDGTYVGKIMVAVNVSWHDPDIYLTDAGDLEITKVNSTASTSEEELGSATPEVFELRNAAGEIIDRIGAFGEMVVANLRAGLIEADKILAPTVETEVLTTKFISPLADGQITITGPVEIQGSASVSGTLTASKIESSTIDQLREKISELAKNINTPGVKEVPTPGVDINTLNAIYQLLEAQPATNSATYADLSFINAEGAFFSDFLAVLGQATITDLRVTNVLELTRLTSPTGTIDLAGNLNVSGNVTVDGNVNILGELTAPTASFSSLLAQKITAEEIKVGQLIIANPGVPDETATNSASITTNATAGKGVIPNGSTELTINSPHVDASSLIYVTPTGDSQNQVLYVKAKAVGSWFKVAINQALPVDLEFNWWIIKLE